MNVELQNILELCRKIRSSSLRAEDQYDMIFSKTISRRVFDLCHLDYYDPDTTYEEDMDAFISALAEKVDRLANER